MMKKKLIILTILLLVFNINFAQKSRLIISSNNKQSFFVYLNGIQQNKIPKTNIQIDNLDPKEYSCKIIFKNKILANIDKKLILKLGIESTYQIVKNNKIKFELQWINNVLLKNSSDNLSENNNGLNQNNTNQNNNNNSIIVTDSKSNVNINQNSVNININLNSGNQTGNTHSTHTDNIVNHSNTDYYKSNGCQYPMSNINFTNAKNSIVSKNFEDSKLTVSKQIISNNCLTSNQIKEIIKLFNFESTRLEIAKYAYEFVFDKGNYFLLNDAFEFESSIDELNNYINTKK